MKFQTEITIPRAGFSITHHDKMLMMGSCFAKNISAKLIHAGFDVDVNPVGILYNPVSISQTLTNLLDKKEFLEGDIFEYNGLFQSFSHHGRFSGTEKDKVLWEMNTELRKSQARLREASYLVVTFGTARAYRLLSNGRVVANCHKLPNYYFSNNLLSMNEIVEPWLRQIERIRQINPKIRVIFTISPIRHWKDGATENQVSKSLLFLAVQEILRWSKESSYFPSYEIMMDELRDYRFYAEDMLHPSNQAVDYIWERFGNTYFTDATKALIRDWESIQQALNHRPFNPDSTEYKQFYANAVERKRRFLAEHPELDR